MNQKSIAFRKVRVNKKDTILLLACFESDMKQLDILGYLLDCFCNNLKLFVIHVGSFQLKKVLFECDFLLWNSNYIIIE